MLQHLCPGCGHLFRERTNLVRHIKIHEPKYTIKLNKIRQEIPYQKNYLSTRNPYWEIDDLSWRFNTQESSPEILREINQLYSRIFTPSSYRYKRYP